MATHMRGMARLLQPRQLPIVSAAYHQPGAWIVHGLRRWALFNTCGSVPQRLGCGTALAFASTPGSPRPPTRTPWPTCVWLHRRMCVTSPRASNKMWSASKGKGRGDEGWGDELMVQTDNLRRDHKGVQDTTVSRERREIDDARGDMGDGRQPCYASIHYLNISLPSHGLAPPTHPWLPPKTSKRHISDEYLSSRCWDSAGR